MSPIMFSLFVEDLEFYLQLKAWVPRQYGGTWSGGAKVLGKLPVPGCPTYWLSRRG